MKYFFCLYTFLIIRYILCVVDTTVYSSENIKIYCCPQKIILFFAKKIKMENLLQNQALVKVKKSIFLTCLYVALLTAKYKKKIYKEKDSELYFRR